MTDPVARDRPPTREELAEEIVDAILDRPFADPDDDLAKLARRFLRSDRLLAAGVLPPDTLNAARFCRYGHPTPLRDFCAQGHPLLEAASAAPGLRERIERLRDGATRNGENGWADQLRVALAETPGEPEP